MCGIAAIDWAAAVHIGANVTAKLGQIIKRDDRTLCEKRWLSRLRKAGPTVRVSEVVCQFNRQAGVGTCTSAKAGRLRNRPAGFAAGDG